MLRNYLKIAYRNLMRQKGYTFINVFGLAVGLAACLVIGLYVRHELSYDRSFPNADRAYRIVRQVGGGGIARTAPGLAGVVARRFPEVKYATIVHDRGETLLGLQGDRFYIDRVFRADSNFYEVFPYELLRGDPDEVLAGPGRMVVTRSLARKLFGRENPVGKVLRVENRADYVITGVMEDPPTNAHFRPNALLSLTDQQRKERYGSAVKWNFVGGYLYVILEEGSDPKALERKIEAFKDARAPEYMKGQTFALQPVTAIHLYSDLGGEIAPQSDVRYLYLFSAIGVLLLLIACVNYVNLSTARASQRAKEVGVRKVVGAYRGQLMRQFLGESVLIVAAALPLTLLLARNALPVINRLAGQELALWTGFGGTEWLVLGGVLLLIGVAAGLYPALYLSGFQPVRVLGGRGIGREGGRLLRKGLVVFQFAASIALIIGTLVVQSQLDYVQRENLGFDEEHVVTFSTYFLDPRWGVVESDRYGAFRQALQHHPQVLSVTSGPPPGLGRKNMGISIDNEETGEEQWLYMMFVDYNYVETLKLDLKAGRSFSRAHPTDAEQAVILTESAVEHFELGAHPVGQSVTIRDDEGAKTVIGVVEDFHNASLRNSVQPLVIRLRPGNNWTALVRLASGNVGAGLAALEATWEQFLPNRPFTFAFLEDRIQAQYQTGQRLARIFGLFAGLAIVIACLGLFGLAAHAAERRTKEIGIRKVLGASVPSIIVLLSKDFLKLVGIAFIIAAPIAWYAMSRWLQDFAYRIDLGPWLFVGAGALALVIALATVSYQAVKAALADPVEALRSE